MRVKLCRHCGYQLPGKAKKCPWCKSQIKKRTPLFIAMLAVLVSPLIGAWALHNTLSVPSLSAKLPPPEAVKVSKERPPVAKRQTGLSTLYVQGRIVNLRRNPFLTSQTVWKLKKGEQLVEVNRSGNWIQVQQKNAERRAGWVHASLVSKVNISPSKPHSEREAYKKFRESYHRFNAEIKRSKGMTFFKDLEYLKPGMIQITATDILLSAPRKYKEKYLRTLMKMWQEERKNSLPAAIKIVDATGRLRLQETRTN
ncbi:MAG: hypothetical protein NPINA01_22020 [Nitrospinaceae bacterium]|nr:MAG: hypothetical protein NPINA01_22020 [Nitrospinaceae bacterium]